MRRTGGLRTAENDRNTTAAAATETAITPLLFTAALLVTCNARNSVPDTQLSYFHSVYCAT